MNDMELADEIERHLKDTESGDQWRAAPLVSFWRGQWQQIIAALRRALIAAAEASKEAK